MTEETATRAHARKLFCPKCRQPTEERTSTQNGFCRPCGGYIFASNAEVTFTQKQLEAALCAVHQESEARAIAEVRKYLSPQNANTELLPLIRDLAQAKMTAIDNYREIQRQDRRWMRHDDNCPAKFSITLTREEQDSGWYAQAQACSCGLVDHLQERE